MKKVFLFLIIFFAAASLSSQNITENRMRIVVMPGRDMTSSGRMTGILNLVIEQMDRLGRFEIIDRRTTQQKMDELKLKLSGITDDEAVIELGTVLSSDIGMIIDLMSFITTESEKRVEVETEGAVTVKYETVYDSVIELTVRQFEINTQRTMKTISVTGEGTSESYASSEKEALRSLRGRLFSDLKEFFPLILQVEDVEGDFIKISGGGNIGVKKGMKFDVKENFYDFDRTGLVRVEKITPEFSVARILKGFASIEPGDILAERINKFPETAIAAAVSVNLDDEITSLYFSAEFDTYSPFSGGFDLLFSLTDPEADFFRINIFGMYKPLLGDRFDFGLRGGGGLTFIYGVEDDEDHDISSLEFQISLGASASFYLNEKLALFCAGDYFFYPARLMDWSYFTGSGEDRTRHDAVGETPDIDPDGFYLTAGIKIIP